MGISKESKLKSLVRALPQHGVVTRSALASLGITPQHTQKYVAGGWLESIGSGAFKRPGDAPTWQTALHALQTQEGLAVHVGGLTSLAAEGAAQFVRPGHETIWLFSGPGIRPPLWFRKHRWPVQVTHVTSKFLSESVAVRSHDFGGFSLLASASERAILECLFLAPERMDLVEVFGLLESQRTLRPKVMQSLLEECSSVKVKRLFMFMAEQAALPVFARLDQQRIELGRGARSLVPKGAYVAKYELVVPRALVSG
jgi:hypothetical protein